MNKKKITSLFLLFLIFACKADALALENNPPAGNKGYTINLSKDTIAKGYTVSAFENRLKLSLLPGILNEATAVEALELHENLPLPWGLELVGAVYQFEFKNKTAYAGHKPFYIQFAYSEESSLFKQAYFFDKNGEVWRPLPTVDNPEKMIARSLIHLPYARIALFARTDVLSSGKASWYAHKSGDFAASPDFPAGSRLRVHNSANNKFVDVVINDFGPDRTRHPDRALDLEKNAFKKIAPLGGGLADIWIEPIYIAKPASALALDFSLAIGTEPDIKLKSAIAINEEDGTVLWKKNSTSTLPLASLSKIAAVKVYLDTKPSLDKIVTYSLADEEHNYKYANKWELARLRIGDGETLSIADLIYSSLVGSANNTVETLVRVSGIPRTDFIAKMNEQVRVWGASSTFFVEPTGLSPENVSSAADYAIISQEALKHPIIAKASGMKQYEFSTRNAKKYHKIKNTNQLINGRHTINASKTGYLIESGYCLMSRAARKNGKNIIVVTFGADTKSQSLAETDELIRYALSKL